MTKRIFRSIMLVSAVCMVTGLAFLMGVLYHFFGNQLEKELKVKKLPSSENYILDCHK